MPHPGKDKELKARIRSDLERGVEAKEIADSTNVPSTTIRRWQKNLKLYGQMDAPPQGVHKGLSVEMQTYLLGYLHGRPDAQLVEMRRILNEAFDQDVSLPTLSRTLKLRGCMKGHRKQRDFRPAPTLTPTKPKDNVIMVTPSSSVPDGVLAPSGVHPINPADHSGSTGEASHPETNAILQRITTDTTTEAYQSPYPDLSNTEQSSLVFEQLQDYMNLVEQTPQEPVTPLDPTICS